MCKISNQLFFNDGLKESYPCKELCFVILAEVIDFILSLVPKVPIPSLPSQLPPSITNPMKTFQEDIAKGILEILKRMGISNVPLQRITDSVSVNKLDGTTRRLSGTVSVSTGGAMFTFEAIKQEGLAVGFTTNKVMFAQITKTLFKKELNLFGNTRETSVSIRCVDFPGDRAR